MFQPTTFGHYFLTRRIAIGGMAEVFAAKLYGADGFEKDIVIKQILPQYARDPEFVQSFVAEAKIVVSLSHANIASIYELGRVEGTYFIAMELVDGLDVFAMIDGAKRMGERIDPGLSLLIAEEVSKGLDYAHRKLGPDGQPLGLVHRDLSPRNVLVSREGEVKILDFGIAKTRSEAAAMPKTRAGVVKGTTGYMSPEQATGGEVDSRTDVYQTGLLLWELLTGESLFWRPDDGETRELMRRHRVVAPSEINPAIPEELDRLVLSALVRDPARRIPTAADLGAAIARVRISRYPHAMSRDLGALVARIALDEERGEQLRAADLPATAELQTAAARVETFASVVLTPPPPPPPASAPIAPIVPLVPAPATAVMALQAPPVVLEPEKIVVTALAPPVRGNRMVVAGAFVVALAAVVVWGVGALADRKNFEAPPDPKISPPVVQKSAEPALVGIPTATVAVKVAEPVIIEKRVETKTKKAAVNHTGVAMVSFGTKSCSSRVSIDGSVVARSTPSFDHKVPSGEHTITIEGTSCPLIERPGSLKPSIPTVVRRIEVKDGTRLKVIADFNGGLIAVKEE